MSPTKVLSPLSPFEAILLPLLRLTRRGAEREKLNRRADLTAKRAQRLKEHQDLQKVLRKECKLYEKLIVDCYIRIGQAHMLSAAGIETGGRTPRKQKVQKVKFSRIFFNDERIFFEIQVNRRWLHTTKNMLPHMVLVADLIDERAVFELGHATRRLITTSYADARYGAWIIVNRLIGFDGLPLQVTYREMLENFPTDMISDVPLMLGAGQNRHLMIFSLASHPHMLTGGSTGSGKSNFLNNLICNFLRFSRAHELKLILIDLKRLEFGYYRDAPHLMRSIVTSAEEALTVLQGAYDEIQARFQLMETDSKELTEYNEKHPDKTLPRVVIIIDEFAQLIYDEKHGRAIELLVTRITNLGRAPGVHMIVATQRPGREVVPNTIKINMPLVVAGRVQNSAQSNVILGSSAAADLPVLPGRMICLSGANETQVQTPLVTKEDIFEAMAIAHGRANGVIDLDGWEPVIVPDGLIVYIVDKLGGKMTNASLKSLDKLGVPARALRTFFQELITAGKWQVGERLFRVVKREGNYWAIAEEFPFTYDETQPAPSVRPDWPAFPLPPLQLPARIEEAAAATQEMFAQPVEPEVEATKPAIHPLVMTDDEIIDLFIAQRCRRGGKFKIATRDLHNAYIDFCESLDPDLRPVDIKKLTKSMQLRGFKKHPDTRTRALAGITLLSAISADSLDGEHKGVA